MSKPLRVLMVEDSEEDVLLMILALKKGGYDPVYERVETAEALRAALGEKTWDVILCDYAMPHFNGSDAIVLLKEIGIDIPLVIVSGAIGEETAVACMRLGACDCIMKGNLLRLIPTIERALIDAASKSQRKQAEAALRRSEENLRRSLDGLPVGVRIVTEQGETLYANRAILNIYGYDNIDEFKMTPVVARYTPESYADYQIRKERRRQGIDDRKEYVINIIRKDGDTRCLQVLRSEILWDGQRQFQVIYQNITERKQAEEELTASRFKLRALAMRLQQVREEERMMLAREIHDDMGGGLTGLKMDLSWLLHKIGDADPREERVALINKIQASNEMVDQMIHAVRRISTDLRPSILDDLGLVAALEWQLMEFTKRTEILHEFTTTLKYVNMEEHTAVAVFRIFQEALTNIVRHAGATKVFVVLRAGERSLFGDESLLLEVRDNGWGITEEAILHHQSLGLLGMKERALALGGALSIHGKPGGGTSLVLKVPCKHGELS